MGNSKSTANESKIHKIPENLLVEQTFNQEKLLKTENVLKTTEDEYANRKEVVEETIQATQVPTVFHILQAPKLCPAGYKLDHQGRCRKIIY
ncbi:unnamed protein product [Diamesa serratosioi]